MALTGPSSLRMTEEWYVHKLYKKQTHCKQKEIVIIILFVCVCENTSYRNIYGNGLNISMSSRNVLYYGSQHDVVVVI